MAQVEQIAVYTLGRHNFKRFHKVSVPVYIAREKPPVPCAVHEGGACEGSHSLGATGDKLACLSLGKEVENRGDGGLALWYRKLVWALRGRGGEGGDRAILRGGHGAAVKVGFFKFPVDGIEEGGFLWSFC